MSFFNANDSRRKGGAHVAGGAHSPRRAPAHSREAEPAPRRESAPVRSHAQRPEQASRRARPAYERAPSRPSRPSHSGIFTTVLAVVLGLVLVALLVVFAIFGVFRVRYMLPDGSKKTELVLRGHEAKRAPEPVMAGYTFIGWEEGDSGLFPLGSTPIYENTVLHAVMMPELNTADHLSYLSPDENGFIHPDELMLRGEVAEILCSFISAPVQAGDNYADVDSSASYAWATSVLKALDAVPSERFRPEEPISFRELVAMVGHFYPVLSWEELAVYPEGADPDDPDAPYTLRYTFADLSQLAPDYAYFCTAASRGWISYGPDVKLSPSNALTRAEAAAYLNRVLGRGQGLQVSAAQAGKLLDLPPSHPMYADVLEAAVPHSALYSGVAESWQSSEPFPVRDVPSGFMFIGTQLYCVDDDGYLVMDDSVNGFAFGPDGRFTSGKAELDELVQQVLGEITDASMTDMEKLRAAYDYTVYTFTYIKGNHYERGDVSWAAEEAYSMLSTGYGNCYNFAGAFYELARALGQDATLISGFYGDNYLYHAWVEFTVDGERRICDPEVEWTYLDNPELEKPDMFMMTVAYSKRWHYTA